MIIAAEQLKYARDPAVISFLKGVIRDESRHAELAWKTLKWCLSKGGEAVRNRLHEIMLEEPVIGAEDFPQKSIHHFGLCGRKSIDHAIAEGMKRVVRPSFASLLNI